MQTLAPRYALLLRTLAAVSVCAVLVAVDLGWRGAPPPAALAVMGPSGSPAESAPLPALERTEQGHIPMPVGAASAHASSLLPMPPDHPWSLMAFWFAGSREAAPDVQIAMAHVDRNSKAWSAARYALGRQDLGFGTTRLGNPGPWLDRQGRVHLFVVATGLGGWAAARIVHLRQRDAASLGEDHGFAVQQVLPLSWLWNYSFLVRNTPLDLQDGGMVLPAYFEMGPHSAPVALRFDAEGNLRSFTRMGQDTQRMQPALLALGDTRWLALMRDGSPQRHIRVSTTNDAGAQWTDAENLQLPNPDSSLASLRLPDGTLLLAHNNTREGRHRLDLSASRDGLHWTPVGTVAQGDPGTEYSYPSLAWDGQQVWLSYTDQRRQIAWQRFAVIPAKH
jgi:predicted neuraminidase